MLHYTLDAFGCMCACVHVWKLSPTSHKLWFFPAVLKKHSGHKCSCEPTSWVCLLFSVILNLPHSLAWCIFPSPPAVHVTNLLCDIFWQRSRGDKRSRSLDASITITFLWSNAISLLSSLRFWLPPKTSVLLKPKRSFWKRRLLPRATGVPVLLNKQLPHERCWLLCEPSQGVSAWRLAQTVRSMYGACGEALCSLSLHLPLYLCILATKWRNKRMCLCCTCS